jgi:hypothetical protein
LNGLSNFRKISKIALTKDETFVILREIHREVWAVGQNPPNWDWLKKGLERGRELPFLK